MCLTLECVSKKSKNGYITCTVFFNGFGTLQVKKYYCMLRLYRDIMYKS
jgi:hypothetical protein